MGHQFQVYLTKDDENGVVSALQAQFGVMIFRPVFYTDEERTVAALSELGRYPTDVQLALTAPQFVRALLFTKFQQGHTRLDLGNSPIIEFGRCTQHNDVLRRGRFWYKLDSIHGKKSEDFKKWSSSIFRFLKKELVKLDAPPASYAGWEAAEKLRAGELKQGW
jgi:hypothetical protein